jgi:hypothetical protein
MQQCEAPPDTVLLFGREGSVLFGSVLEDGVPLDLEVKGELLVFWGATDHDTANHDKG